MSKDEISEFMAGITKYLPGKRGPLVNVVSLSGVIGAMGGFRSGLSLALLEPVLERAFKPKKLKAVALSINSPGGSPVQSTLIAKRIRALAAEREVPVFAFAEDVAASGGYWLACAADEIFAESSSIVGSIGVVSGGFGFPELLKRYGIERRLHTSGDKKAMLDPFSPEKAGDIKHLKSLQAEIHDDFINMVRERRGARLIGVDKEVFSGAFWTGTKAKELGLIDGLGDLRSVMTERYGEDVRLRPIKAHQSFWKRKLGGAEARNAFDSGFGHELGNGFLSAAEERMIWNRFGL